MNVFVVLSRVAGPLRPLGARRPFAYRIRSMPPQRCSPLCFAARPLSTAQPLAEELRKFRQRLEACGGTMLKVEAVTAEMLRLGVQPDAKCMELILAAYSNQDRSSAVDRIVQLGLLFTPAFNFLLGVLARFGDVAACERTLSYMTVPGCTPETGSYNHLMVAHLVGGPSARCVASCEEVLQRMAAAGLEPDVVSFNTLMTAHIKEGDDGSRSEAVMKQMVSCGVSPSIVSFGTLLSAYTHARPLSLQRCESVLNRIRAAGLRPTLAVFNALLRAYSHAGDPAGCHRTAADQGGWASPG